MLKSIFENDSEEYNTTFYNPRNMRLLAHVVPLVLIAFGSFLKVQNESIRLSDNLLVMPLGRLSVPPQESYASFPLLYLKYTHTSTLLKCHSPFHADHSYVDWFFLCHLLEESEWLSYSLTQGQWRDFFSNGSSLPGAPSDPGAHVHAFLQRHRFPLIWKNLMESVGALTDSSLALLSSLDRVSILDNLPERVTHQYGEGFTVPKALNATHFRYIVGRLPDQNLCTENLARLFLALPCASKSSLIQPFMTPSVFSTHRYRTLKLSITRGSHHRLMVQLVVSTVVDFFFEVNLNTLPLHMFSNNSTSFSFDILSTQLPLNISASQSTFCSTSSVSAVHLLLPTLDTFFFHRMAFKEAEQAYNVTFVTPVPPWNSERFTVSFYSTDTLRGIRCDVFVGKHHVVAERLEGTYNIRCQNRKSYTSRVWYIGVLPSVIQPLLHTLRLHTLGSDPQIFQGLAAFEHISMRWAFPTSSQGLSNFMFSYDIPSREAFLVEFLFWKPFLDTESRGFSSERGLYIPGGFYYEEILNTHTPQALLLDELFKTRGNNTSTGCWIRSLTSSVHVMFPFPEPNMIYNGPALSTLLVVILLDRIVKLTFGRTAPLKSLRRSLNMFWMRRVHGGAPLHRDKLHAA